MSKFYLSNVHGTAKIDEETLKNKPKLEQHQVLIRLVQEKRVSLSRSTWYDTVIIRSEHDFFSSCYEFSNQDVSFREDV